jgi:cytochrome d ubiquinol oxidase subunit II
LNKAIAHRWFDLPNLLLLSPVPILVVITMWKLNRSIQQKRELSPFIYALFIIFLGYIGFGISIWPNIIPPDITLWQAAAPLESQRFALVGTVIIIPIILIYTAWSYYVFRGKVREDDGYH